MNEVSGIGSDDRRSVDTARSERLAGQRPAVGRAELAQQRRHVRLDRADGDEQTVGDLGVRQVLLHEGEHLSLPRRQRAPRHRRL